MGEIRCLLQVGPQSIDNRALSSLRERTHLTLHLCTSQGRRVGCTPVSDCISASYLYWRVSRTCRTQCLSAALHYIEGSDVNLFRLRVKSVRTMTAFYSKYTKRVGSSGNANGLYLGGAQFECRPGHELSSSHRGFVWFSLVLPGILRHGTSY